MNITYDYYRIFYFVAKYQSFTKAANILLSNEPNISRSIRNLEHEFGVSLFIRSNRGVTLTPEGQKLYTRVAAAHHQLSSAEAELADAKSLTSGTITLGVSEAALQILLLPKLREFHQKFPEIKIHISSVTTPQGRLFLKKRTRRPRDRHQPDRRHTPLKGDSASSDPGGSHRRSTLCLPLRHTQNA